MIIGFCWYTLIFNALGYVFKNSVFFFFFLKKGAFLDYQLIHCVFRSIKIFVKNFSDLCLVRLIKPVLQLIEHRESGFLNMDLDFFKRAFSKVFFQVFTLSSIQSWLHLRFLLFLILSFARFLSSNTGKTFLPFFLLLFSHFMHFHAFLIWEFRTMHNLGFLMILAKSCVIDHWVLLVYCYIHDLC